VQEERYRIENSTCPTSVYRASGDTVFRCGFTAIAENKTIVTFLGYVEGKDCDGCSRRSADGNSSKVTE
jgi:hypothetical protein